MEQKNVEEQGSSTISFSSHPLFSCFITLFSLTLIYLPNDYSLRSPVLLISGAFLISLLLLGSTREPNTRPGTSKEGEHFGSANLEETEEPNVVLARDSSLSEAREEPEYSDTKPDFVEWDLRAPLEVIHEAYEEDNDDGEDEEDPSVSGEKDPTRIREIERYPSLSLCYPESDSESDSDSDSSSEFYFPEMGSWISPEKMGFSWEEEEDDDGGGVGEGLIEIKLEGDKYNNKMNKRNQTELDFHAEEEGLIEIDLFP